MPPSNWIPCWCCALLFLSTVFWLFNAFSNYRRQTGPCILLYWLFIVCVSLTDEIKSFFLSPKQIQKKSTAESWMRIKLLARIYCYGWWTREKIGKVDKLVSWCCGAFYSGFCLVDSSCHESIFFKIVGLVLWDLLIRILSGCFEGHSGWFLWIFYMNY